MPEFIVEKANAKEIVLKIIIKSENDVHDDIKDNLGSQISITKDQDGSFNVEERVNNKINSFYHFDFNKIKNLNIGYPTNYIRWVIN